MLSIVVRSADSMELMPLPGDSVVLQRTIDAVMSAVYISNLEAATPAIGIFGCLPKDVDQTLLKSECPFCPSNVNSMSLSSTASEYWMCTADIASSEPSVLPDRKQLDFGTNCDYDCRCRNCGAVTGCPKDATAIVTQVYECRSLHGASHCLRQGFSDYPSWV